MNVRQFLAEYGESHRNPLNKKLHWVCVPLITLAVFGFARAIPVGDPLLNVASIGGALVLVYYVKLSWRLALGMLPIFALMFWLVELAYEDLGSLFLPAMITVFVVAWIGQFVGHWFEGAKPSFFKDLQFLLIGPLWLLAHLYGLFSLGVDGGVDASA